MIIFHCHLTTCDVIHALSYSISKQVYVIWCEMYFVANLTKGEITQIANRVLKNGKREQNVPR